MLSFLPSPLKGKTLAATCVLAVLSSGAAGAKPPSGSGAGSIEFQCPWTVAINPTQVTLKAEIDKVKGVSSEGVLRISREEEQLFSYDPGFGLCPCSMFPLADGNLATVWETAMGSHFHTFIFSYSKGKVSIVLHTVSDGMLPEFVYPNAGHVMGATVKGNNGKPEEIVGGPFFRQRIIVPNTEWVELKKPYVGSRSQDKQPITADIYSWDEKAGKYSVRSKVPWRERLQGR
jgi:hypothetical protein